MIVIFIRCFNEIANRMMSFGCLCCLKNGLEGDIGGKAMIVQVEAINTCANTVEFVEIRL